MDFSNRIIKHVERGVDSHATYSWKAVTHYFLKKNLLSFLFNVLTKWLIIYNIFVVINGMLLSFLPKQAWSRRHLLTVKMKSRAVSALILVFILAIPHCVLSQSGWLCPFDYRCGKREVCRKTGSNYSWDFFSSAVDIINVIHGSIRSTWKKCSDHQSF